MEDTLLETESPNGAIATAGSPATADLSANIAESIGQLLGEHKGGAALVLDLRAMNAWTDFFVIATATSNAHMDGLERHIKEFCHEQGIEILRHSRKPAAMEDEWRLIDLGTVVIHLMSERARAFYELERLYGEARYSSNSSKSSSSS